MKAEKENSMLTLVRQLPITRPTQSSFPFTLNLNAIDIVANSIMLSANLKKSADSGYG